MSAGRLLTLGLGTPFGGKKYLPTLGLGTTGVEPPTPPAPTSQGGGGGGGYAEVWRKRDREKLLQRSRGITRKAAQVIVDVAQRQAEDTGADEQKRFDELSRSLAVVGVAWRADYLEMTNAIREEMVTAELRERLNKVQAANLARMAEEDLIVTLLIMASV